MTPWDLLVQWLVAQAGLCRAGCTGYSYTQLNFEYLDWWRLHNLPGQSVTVFNHSSSKKLFSCVQMDFCVLICCFVSDFCNVTGEHWEESGSNTIAPSLQVFMHTNKLLLNLFFWTVLQSQSSSWTFTKFLIYC